MNLKKMLSVIMATMMLLGTMGMTALADAAWDGTSIDTAWYDGAAVDATSYTIADADDLAGLAKLVNEGNSFNQKTVTLSADIDLGEKEWTPIGNSANNFQGTFDGGGKTISNLLITSGNDYVGLFGYTTNGEVKNLTIHNAKVTGRVGVGALSGCPYTSKYTNITLSGHVEINGMSYVGGVLGRNAYANLTNITVNVDDTSYVYANSIENGTAYRSYVGGVVGFMGEGGHKVTQVTSNIDVKGSTCNVGGITGIIHYGNTFENVTCAGDVYCEDEENAEIGGIAGTWNNGGSPVTMKNCDFTGKTYVADEEVKVPVAGPAYSATGAGKLEQTGVAKIGTTLYDTFEDALAAVESGDVTIELLGDASLSYGAREAYGKADTTSITVNGNGCTLTLNQTDSDWSSIGMANADGVLKLNDMDVVKTGYGATSGAWNTHAMIFKSNVEFTNVDFAGSVAVEGKKSVLKNVNITEDNGYYGLWIPANVDSVEFNGGSITATNGGRGIKIADQYVETEAKQIALTVKDVTFETAKKAAIMVTSTGGAAITVSDIDISKVAADSTNAVWVDEGRMDYQNNVTVTGGTKDTEGAVAKINGYGYASFEKALADAEEGDIIDLLGNTHKLDNTNKNVTKSITIENGTFDITDGVWNGNSIFDIYNGAYLTLNEVDFVGDNYSSAFGVLYARENATVELNDCDFELSNERFTGGGVLKGLTVNEATFIVNDCSFDLENPNRVITGATVALTGVTIDAKVTDDTLVVGDMNNHALRNLVGRVINSTITVDGFETGIKNDGGDLDITGTSVVTLKNSKDVDLNIAAGYQVNVATTAILSYTTKKDTVTDATFGKSVAKADGIEYFSLQDAFDAAADGATVTLMADVVYTQDNAYANGAYLEGLYYLGDKNLTFDLGGHTISDDGSINDYLIYFRNMGETKNKITLKNGTIIAGANAFSALTISSGGAKYGTDVDLENITIETKATFNHNTNAVRVRDNSTLNVNAGATIISNGASAAVNASVLGTSVANINSGAKLVQKNTNASYGGNYVGAAITGLGTVNVYDGATVESDAYGVYMSTSGVHEMNIYGGNFKTTSTVKALLTAVTNGGTGESVTINVSGGVFEGGLKEANKDGHIQISGGMFSADPAAYVADGYAAYNTGASVTPYLVAEKVADKVEVVFAETSKAGVFDIQLESTDAYEIYEFVSAELTFKNASKTNGGADMQYEISGVKDVTSAEENFGIENDADERTFNFRLVNYDDVSDRLTGKNITIGQIKFIGESDNGLNLTVTGEKVAATKRGTNDEDWYKMEDGTLLAGAGIVGGAAVEAKRDVVVNVAFIHDLNPGHWQNNDLTVTLKDAFGKEYDAQDISDGLATFTAVPLGRITVTLSGAGFRTYHYTTVMEESATPLVLNFWNDVKRERAEAIEEGKGTMPHNFLVGDIVMDYTVDEYDLAAVTSYYGMYDLTDADKYMRYDLNRDGNIDIIDVAYVLHTLNN